MTSYVLVQLKKSSGRIFSKLQLHKENQEVSITVTITQNCCVILRKKHKITKKTETQKTSKYTDDGEQAMGEQLKHVDVQMSRWSKHTGEGTRKRAAIRVMRPIALHLNTKQFITKICNKGRKQYLYMQIVKKYKLCNFLYNNFNNL